MRAEAPPAADQGVATGRDVARSSLCEPPPSSPLHATLPRTLAYIFFHPLTRSLCTKLHRKWSSLFRAANFLRSRFSCLDFRRNFAGRYVRACLCVGFLARLERLCAQLCSLLEEQSLAVVFLLEGGSEVCLERFWCVFEVWRRAQRQERKKVSTTSRQVSASLIPPLLASALSPPSASAVVNFSVSFCCHVLFPVDHALLLPPSDSTHLRFLITLTRSPLFVWVCTDGRDFLLRPLIGRLQKAVEDWRGGTRGRDGGRLGVRAEWRWSAWVFLF